MSIGRQRRRYIPSRKQEGYLLLAVAVTLAVIAAAAFLINRESALHVQMSSGGLDATRANYVAQAGLQHALWQTNTSACSGDMTIPSTAFGAHSYDATITAGGATTGYKLSVDQDAWIRSDSPTSNNGTNVDQHVRFESGVVEQSLFRFDLSSLPAGAQINSASAWFYVEAGKPHPEGPITVHRVTSDWTETGATWETMNGRFDSQVLATIPAQAQSDVWVHINLTTQVQAWVNGQPNYGILLSSTAEGVHGEYVSREGAAGQRPRLDVVVGTAPASPASIQATGALANGVSRSLSRSGVPVRQPAATLILQPDAVTGKDTWVSEWKQTWNYGKDDELDVDSEGSSKRSLLQFDLSAIPPAATVLSATLDLYQNDPSTWGGTVAVHRILSDWAEGDTWASTGAANWTERESGVPWVAAGADYDALPVATTTLPAGVVDWFQWDVTSLVGGWVAGLYNNNGLVLVGGGDGAHFVSSDNNDASLRPKLTITYACECGIACVIPQGSGNVLMVVVNPTTLVPADAEKKALFESWGYTVEVISESANQSTFDTGVSNNDVVYISNTVNSNTLGNKLVDVTIGVVTDDGDYNADFGIASGAAWTTGNTIDVVDNSHYITLPLPLGALDIYSADMEGLTVSGTEAPGLQTLADRSGVGTLVVLDEGAQMASGGTTAGRRVMLPLGRSTTSNFSWDYLSNNGRLIVQRALEWGIGAAAPTSCNADYVPNTRVASFEYPSGTQFKAMHGLTFVPEGFELDGVLAPAGGAWVAVDWSTWNFRMYDMTGAVLSETLATPTGNLNGLTLVGGGTYTGYLATVRSSPTSDTLYYVDPIGTEPTVAMNIQSISADPSGVAYIGGSASGTYDDHLAITDDFTNQIYIISQGGSLVHTVDLSGVAAALSGIVHLPGTDRFLTADQGSDRVRVVDFDGNVSTSYDLSAFNLPNAQAIAVNPETCDHALGNDVGASGLGLDEVVYLNTGGASGPLAHWKLDETSGTTAVDSAGGNDGTLNNGPVWTPGTIDGGLDFDGSDDYVVTDSSFTPPPVGTVTFWMKVSGSPGSHGRILGLSDTWEIRHVTTGTPDGIPYGLVFDLGVSGVNTEFVTTVTIDTPNQWYHIAASYDTNTDAYAVYIDGVPHKSGTYPSALSVPTANPLSLGTRTGSSNYYDGVLDDVRVYDTVLTPAEIADLAAGGSGCSGTFHDEFNAVSYSGSDGTLPWSTDWLEIAESDGPNGGDERVTNDQSDYQLQVRDNDGGGEGVEREADLSGYTSATLSFDYRRQALDNADDYVTVEVSNNGGGAWTEIDRFQGSGTDSSYQPVSYDISSYIAPNTRIRFLSSSNLGTNDMVFFDNVEICVSN